jgi:hypothetical protein
VDGWVDHGLDRDLESVDQDWDVLEQGEKEKTYRCEVVLRGS